MKKLFVICLIIFSESLSAQNKTAIYPSNWWVNMKWNKVQLMLQGKGIGSQKLTMQPYPGVKLIKTHNADHPDYIFADIDISPSAKPGSVKFLSGRESINWELKQRRPMRGSAFAQGIRPNDLVYLIMPDRFSNGDYTNDKIPGLRDQTLDRDSMYHRHGGDLQGIIDHLDYLQDLGVTAIWMMPVLENDMPSRSEHGYAFTNHYKIEPRLGGAETYKKLSDALHKRGMKLIQDAVYNHVGIYHHTVLNKPFKDWLHEWPSFTQTSYKDQVLFDPYAAPSESKIMSDGWFVSAMPDLNHDNPFVANFLIQHALWSVEEFGVDGWRIDTYAYNDLKFMNRCNKALTDEYPAMTMFGETWVHGVPNQSYFCDNNYITGFKSNLQNTTDFQTLFYGIQPAVNEKFGWTEGVNKLYTTAAQDFLYKNPSGQVIFLDNHDISRFYSVVNEDTSKYKVALGWLLTFRGIPQMYYGMEHLMTGYSNPDGNVRFDFRGGWKEDKINKFTESGRTAKENEIFSYIKKIANYRKTSSAITKGKMMQYVPDDGLYTYFRYDNNQTIMCVMNTSNVTKQVNFSKYPERTSGFTRAINIVSGESLTTSFSVMPMTITILELGK